MAGSVRLMVEVQNQVEVLGDDGGPVHRTWDPDVEVQCQVRLEQKIGIQVVRDLEGAVEKVDARGVYQEIVW